MSDKATVVGRNHFTKPWRVFQGTRVLRSFSTKSWAKDFAAAVNAGQFADVCAAPLCDCNCAGPCKNAPSLDDVRSGPDSGAADVVNVMNVMSADESATVALAERYGWDGANSPADWLSDTIDQLVRSERAQDRQTEADAARSRERIDELEEKYAAAMESNRKMADRIADLEQWTEPAPVDDPEHIVAALFEDLDDLAQIHNERAASLRYVALANLRGAHDDEMRTLAGRTI